MPALRLAASNIGWRAEDDDRVLDLMSHLGFSGLEIAPTRVIPDNPYDHTDQIATYAEQVRHAFGLKLCSMQSIWRGCTQNIFDEQGSGELLDYTKKALDFAQAGSIRNLVFGCPRNRSVPAGRDQDEAKAFLEHCGFEAERRGCIFAIEANPPLYGTNFLNATLDALTYLKGMPTTAGLGINLDVGTLLAMDEGMDIVRQAMPFVSHVHISEPGLSPVEPRALHGTLRAMLEDYCYAGYVSLEMSTHDYQTVRTCLEYLVSVFLD